MASGRHPNRGAVRSEEAAVARRRLLESRLEEIGVEISRLRRARQEVVEEFRAFTAGSDADPGRGPGRSRQVERVAQRGHALETYAAELADRGGRAKSVPAGPTADGTAARSWSRVRPPSRQATHPAVKVAVPALLLAAVMVGSSMIVGRWWGEDPPRIPGPGPGIDAPPADAPANIQPAPVATSGQTESLPLKLELTTIREVWIRTVADDGPASAQLLAANKTITINADRFVELRVGDAGAVIWRLNGEDGGPLGRDGEVIARRFEANVDEPKP